MNAALLPPVPRILVIDLTCRGDGTATGALKETLFADWPRDSYLQVHAAGSDGLGLAGSPAFAGRYAGQADDGQVSEIIRAFAPQLILYRPVPERPGLHLFAMGVIRQFAQVPLAIWIMDDWPTSLALQQPSLAACLDHDLRWLLNRAVLRLAICTAMCAAFTERYGVPFLPFGNGVEPATPPVRAARTGPFTLRYSGSLAANMTLHALILLSQAVEQLNADGIACRLEINTRPFWRDTAQMRFTPFSHTILTVHDRTEADYLRWLAEGDAVVIAYNFDEMSAIYCRYSMANKLPEMLVSGAPLLALGPADNATISYVREQGCGLVVDQRDVTVLRQALAGLIASPAEQSRLADQAVAVAQTCFEIGAIRRDFMQALSTAAGPALPQQHIVSDTHWRLARARLDETEMIARLFDQAPPAEYRPVMLDVGAHFGSSSQYFVNRGWRIFCFEPDPANRAKLETRFSGQEGLSIHAVALGEAEAASVPFFTSTESTGISSLLAFRDSHTCAEHVPVTTIDAFTREHGITRVDFLKIDAEGWDFRVLKGVPWDRLRPDVIECEFEDAKTTHLGYRMIDMADLLVGLGYSVYVSEWHPIIRYGIRHDWCRMSVYPTRLRDPDCWGNLLAFRTDPGPVAVNRAIDQCLKVDSPAAIAWTRQAVAHPHIIAMADDLRAVPADRPVWIYGASQGGRIVLDILNAQGGRQVAGFIDTFRDGEMNGLPVRRLASLDLYGMAPASIVVASQFSREIIRSMRMLPQDWLYDAALFLVRRKG
ncbi:hypothetical protein CHU95_02050 [Niveispirillum lacus]|uniref:Methyltransferase FkbM domain-containing protein n=1 Tax=Niveispirillum lacus TaxID=1981099 RepID=A0A255Z6U6_9PROT|nr:FkbM family methyltransferase [Niveispirillum lacus]OYQ37152.1 hypothetical protein CHU95_02050 [Niveispirillum lacus]